MPLFVPKQGILQLRMPAEQTTLLPQVASEEVSPHSWWCTKSAQDSGLLVVAEGRKRVLWLGLGALVLLAGYGVVGAKSLNLIGAGGSGGAATMSSLLFRVWARGFDQYMYMYMYFNPVTDMPGMEGWLNCSLYDDDSSFPDEAGCYTNDWDTYCDDTAGSVCNSISGTCYLSEEICHNSCLMEGSNFGLVCMYQALASLRNVCENKFVPSLPSGKNLGPSLSTELNSLSFDSAMRKGDWLTEATVGSGDAEDPCAYHAFCSNCINGSPSTEWTTNTGCWEGALIEGPDLEKHGKMGAQFVIEKLDFYCQSDILEMFETGELTVILKGGGDDTADIRKRYANAGSEKFVFPPASAETIGERQDLCFELTSDAAEELCYMHPLNESSAPELRAAGNKPEAALDDSKAAEDVDSSSSILNLWFHKWVREYYVKASVKPLV